MPRGSGRRHEVWEWAGWRVSGKVQRAPACVCAGVRSGCGREGRSHARGAPHRLRLGVLLHDANEIPLE